ncbi:helix-turn-helix transcriptional regulator [Collinsella sp. An2]|uniref:helix-turn-helix domain-containing protein n=1 Tax=Collinsella sp. An2 TaxID=1965585 RepID=UPI001EF4E992|nr:helix-turn-helix transcriptional regulator [Collinsella sp. An2]
MMTGDKTTGAGAQSADEPLTDELLHELLSSPSPIDFTEARGITHRSLAEYLNQLLEAKGLKRADVVRAAGINETFGYQIFKGQRNPSRDKVLQLALAMGCDLLETNRLLKAAGVNELYCKDRRDAIILFCIDRGLGLLELNEELYRFGEEPLGG